jgi:hypothetical protein
MQPESITEQKLQLGKEYPETNETKIAEDIVQMLKDQMLRMYPPGSGKKQLRQVHPKMNGCVKAQFIIDPDLPPELKVGLFKEAKSYPAWIRFSNGETKLLPDKIKDFRGFALKVMNVPGKKLDPNDPDIPVHDFVLMSQKIFFPDNIYQFKKILNVLVSPNTISSVPGKVWTGITNIPALLRAVKGKIRIENPVAISYHSTTPYRFGDESRAGKYEVRPTTAKEHVLSPDLSSDNFLRVNLAATLKEHEVTYDFGIHFQTDPVKMPIENSSVEWNSEFVKLATIRIPAQVFDTDERNEFGDNLAFNTWHCLAEHRPVGAVNRVRKIIYEEMYDFRHKSNNIEDFQPTAGPDFFDDTKFS